MVWVWNVSMCKMNAAGGFSKNSSISGQFAFKNEALGPIDTCEGKRDFHLISFCAS